MPRKPVITDAERLAVDCTRCGAVAGAKCHDYRGVNKAWCMERGRPEVAAKKRQRKADQINAKVGPAAQFPGLLGVLAEAEQFKAEFRPVTVEELEARQLAGVRRGVENGGLAEHWASLGFNWITLRYMRRVAAELVGAEWEAKLWAYCERVFRTNLDHIASTYCDALTRADPIDLAHEVRFDPARVKTTLIPRAEGDPRPPIEVKNDGRYLVVTETWPPPGYTPVMTHEEFRSRFELRSIFHRAPTDLPEPDDGGLFERTIGTLTGKVA